MEKTFSNINIIGISTALPRNKLDILSLSPLYGEMEIKRIMASTGINQVSVALPEQRASDLCYGSAVHLFQRLQISPSSLDAIVFVSQTADARLPATSAMLQHRLGLSSRVLAFDINYGCSGYIYGLFQAAVLIESQVCQRVLVCAGDTITRHLDPADHSVRLVFGDAGSATIVEKGADSPAFAMYTDGRHFDKLTAAFDGYLKMDGKAVMEFALQEVPLCVERILNLKNWKKEEVNSYVFHQANQFMLNYLRKKMQLIPEVVPIAVKETGNTGPASIPLTLTSQGLHQEQNNLKKVILCGFGVGFSWGAIGLDLSKTLLLPPLEIGGLPPNKNGC